MYNIRKTAVKCNKIAYHSLLFIIKLELTDYTAFIEIVLKKQFDTITAMCYIISVREPHDVGLCPFLKIIISIWVKKSFIKGASHRRELDIGGA